MSFELLLLCCDTRKKTGQGCRVWKHKLRGSRTRQPQPVPCAMSQHHRGSTRLPNAMSQNNQGSLCYFAVQQKPTKASWCHITTQYKPIKIHCTMSQHHRCHSTSPVLCHGPTEANEGDQHTSLLSLTFSVPQSVLSAMRCIDMTKHDKLASTPSCEGEQWIARAALQAVIC